MTLAALPRRGAAVRELGLALPEPGAAADRRVSMPGWRRGRPLKRWRYVGVYGPELMLCAGDARIGPLRQRWWAVVDRGGTLAERTSSAGSAGLRFEGSRVMVETAEARIDVALGADEGCRPVESISRSGSSGYVWTRKQAGLPARGTVDAGGRSHQIDASAVVDETAGYHERHTTWRWSAGVGRAAGGQRVGWNLVSGIGDDPEDSERTVWIDGEPTEVGPVRFAEDLSAIELAEGGELRFSAWAAREHRANLLVLRSSYSQPFGTFEGELRDGVRLTEGYGVMEWHDVRW